MFATPFVQRGAKRRLFSTPRSGAKRSRVSVGVRAFRNASRRTLVGPRTRGSLSSQVKSLQRVVRQLAPEKKWLDQALSTTNLTSAGAIGHITQISQGDGQSNRTGNTVNVTDLILKGLWLSGADSPIEGYGRIAVVQDGDCDPDTLPAPGDIFTDGLGTAHPVSSLPNLANLERFKVLYLSKPVSFKMLSMDTDNTTAIPTMSKAMEWTWKGNIKVSYNGSASTDFQKNAIYLVFLTDAAGNTVDWSGVVRVGYTDV